LFLVEVLDVFRDSPRFSSQEAGNASLSPLLC